MEFSDDEVRALANKLAEIIMPQVQELVENKARWSIKEMSKLQGQWLSIQELADLFSVSDKHIRNLIKEGLPHVWVGNTIRIEKTFIEGAIADGRLSCQE